MLEVIFHGTTKKPSSDFAKVVLHFDNSNRNFPIEEDVINISRTVNRKGISIYKLNGRTVTRENVLEVLRAAHIHPDGHNIILQGDVTEIIEMSPYERREIVDEISGIKEFDEKREKAQRELQTVEERFKETGIILGEKDTNIKKLESEWRAAQKYKELTNELDKLRASLSAQKLEQTESSIKKIDDRISQKQKDMGKFEKEAVKIDSDIKKTEGMINELNKELFDRAKDIDKIKEIEKLKSEISWKKSKTELNKSEVTRLEDTIKTLEFLSQKESQSKAVQEILRLNKPGVYGTISSLIDVPEEYKIAIEVAAGSHLQDVIVSDENVAIECIRYLKENKIGRATFLPLNKITPREFKDKKILKEKNIIGLAIELIEFDKKYNNAFSFVFGDTVIIKKIETAKEIGIGKYRFASLDGDLIERSGAIIGGYYQKRKIEFEEIDKYKKRKSELQKENGTLENEINEINKKLERVPKHEIGIDLIKFQNEMNELKNKLIFLKDKMKEFDENKIALQTEINNLTVNKAKWEAAIENLRTEFENVKKTKDIYKLSVSTLETKIQQITASINELGAINFKALEEYEQEKTKYKDLKGKIDKLIEERDKILSIINEIEEKRKGTFEKTLNELKEQFKIVFKDLIGGESDLRLEGESLEESGLIIEASPAGKKLLNIDAMSGGEKTLAALSFLFAIQKFRPAPFYILDEIDAALDKPNTKKIADLIKTYSKYSQFVVITHNDTTVAIADCVYGCSMIDGESKLVGIRMPE